MEIIINTGEKSLINEFEQHSVGKFKTASLTIGDIHITIDGKIAFVIERKTVADYKSSRNDGRSKEQCQRMLAMGLPNNKLCYIIEHSEDIDEMTESSLLHKQIGLGITIIYSRDTTHTARVIAKIAKTLSEDHTIHGYDTNAKIKKRSLLSQKDVFIQQLMCIPGISKKSALEIVFNTKTLYNFLMIIWNNGNIWPEGSMMIKKATNEKIKKYLF